MTTGGSQPGWPLPARYAAVGATVAGGIGAIVGLIIGLGVYAPTALFALVELGLPSALLGAVLGALVGAVLTVRRRTLHKRSG